MKDYRYVKWAAVSLGFLLIGSTLWLWWIAVFQSERPEVPSPITVFPAGGGLLLLFYCSLASSRFQVYVGERREVLARVAAEQKVAISPSTETVLELDSKRLTEYYAINQSQARWSFFWAVIAFIAGFTTILSGVWFFYLRDSTKDLDLMWLTTIAGVVTNVIASLFLYLYTSIHDRSMYYYNQLVRVQLLDVAIRIAESHHSIEEKTKAKNKVIVELLSGHFHKQPSEDRPKKS